MTGAEEPDVGSEAGPVLGLTFGRLKRASFTHSVIYTTLLVVWLVPGLHTFEFIFGLAHGLVILLPVIAFFGIVLAWIRSVTRSVLPGIVLHSLFNLLSLVIAVTLNG